MSRAHRGRLAVAALAAVGVVLSSPFIGELRAAIRSAFPVQFQAIVSAAVVTSVVAASIAAVARIRDRRAWRCGVLAASLVGAALYARLVATGNPDVDVVEQVHFVEYGVIAWLFYRACRPIDNGLALAWPLLAAVLAGIADESLQWYVPSRVGEAHDILLNGVAVACGLCFAASVDPPARLRVPLDRTAIRPLAYALSAVILAFAAFFQTVHLGHQVYEPDIGVFWSRYTAEDLVASAAERAATWRVHPPTVLHRFSREDHYLSEAVWHVQSRNGASSAGDPFTAWRENRILEVFFASVLDTPSYAWRVPPRWPPEQRAQTASRVSGDPGLYISHAARYPIYTWSPIAFWLGVAAIIAALISAC